MAADGAELAAEVEYAFESIQEPGLELLRAYLDQEKFVTPAGLFAVWLRELLDGKRSAKLNPMEWPDLAVAGLLVGSNMIIASAADGLVFNFGVKCNTVGVLAAASRLMFPALEQARIAKWN